MGMAERIIIRLAERQNRLWRLAAAAEGLSLSAWLRQLADAAMDSERLALDRLLTALTDDPETPPVAIEVCRLAIVDARLLHERVRALRHRVDGTC